MKNIGKLLGALVVLACAVSCHPKDIRSFGSTMETFGNIDTNGQKVYLTDNENWLFWEKNDTIKLIVNRDNSTTTECALVSGDGGLTATFMSETEIVDEGDYYAFYPSTLNPSYTSDYFTITLPNRWNYRELSDEHHDHSFGRGAIPMVSYHSGKLEKSNLYFHPVAGIMRFQLYSTAATAYTIDSVEIEASPSVPTPDVNDGVGRNKISGSFKITRTSIEDPEPYIEPFGVTNAADRKIVIAHINQPVGAGNESNLCTFYLPLPATEYVAAASDGPHNSVYVLKMTVRMSDSEGNKFKCVRTLKVNIHRCNMTMMRALNLSSPVADDDAGTGGASIELVGCGTQDRPFQIYSFADLRKVRDAMPNGTVNGQSIRGLNDANGPTYFKIVRSDIVIPHDETEWPSGIRNFKGVMFLATSAHGDKGITNNSHWPLFDSISAQGKIEGIILKGNPTDVEAIRDEFSPLCYINRGIMKDCHNMSNVRVVNGKSLAGLCAINYGTIQGGANEGNLTVTTTQGGDPATTSVSGICYQNYGNIQGSFTLSVATPSAAQIAGICFNNSCTTENAVNYNGNVYDCIVASNINPINSTGNWGIIVFNNEAGATINNCRSAGSLVFTTNGSIGGICHNNAGIVKNCKNTVTLEGSSGSIGGIVAVMTGGLVYNCDSEGDHEINGHAGYVYIADYAGGIIGQLQGGTVINCYNHCRVTGAMNSGGCIGTISAGAVIENCWSGYGHRFIGVENVEQYTGTIGRSCFSAAAGDFGRNCNIIENVHYTITSTKTVRAAYTDQYLSRALNEWVDSAKAAGGPSDLNYWTTLANEGTIFPQLTTNNHSGEGLQTSWSKTRRRRR